MKIGVFCDCFLFWFGKVMQLEYPDITHIQLTKNASVNGVNYRDGMVAVHVSAGGLPELQRLSRWL